MLEAETEADAEAEVDAAGAELLSENSLREGMRRMTSPRESLEVDRWRLPG